jgi:hypothetical protein
MHTANANEILKILIYSTFGILIFLMLLSVFELYYNAITPLHYDYVSAYKQILC